MNFHWGFNYKEERMRMGRKPKNLKGMVVNNIEIVERRGVSNDKKIKWLCRCHCGNEWVVIGQSITSGKTLSCGCLKSKERKHLKWRDVKTVGYEVLDKDKKVNSNERIKIKCNNCKNTGKRSSKYLYDRGYNCDFCKNISMSYGERLFKSLLDYKNIKHEQEFVHPLLPNRRFDFKVGDTFYEINGEQHYITTKKGFSSIEEVKKSDKEKEDFCKDMNFNILFINVSSGKYTDLISKYKEALGINEDIHKEKLLYIFHSYNEKAYEKESNIIRDYNSGYRIEDILKKYDIKRGKLSIILEKNGIKRERVKRKVEVVCLNNLAVYDSVKNAALSAGLKNSGALYSSLKDSSKSGGKDKNGNKLYWIKKEDLGNKYIDNNINEWYT